MKEVACPRCRGSGKVSLDAASPHERLTTLRESAGFTREAAAQYIGVANSTLWRYETGIGKMPATAAISLARLYKVPISRLLGTEE